MTAVNALRDTLNNSDLPDFLYRCDTLNFLKSLFNSQRCQLTLNALYECNFSQAGLELPSIQIDPTRLSPFLLLDDLKTVENAYCLVLCDE